MMALSGLAGAQTVMITGANSGIGLEFAKQYAAKGWTVIVDPPPPGHTEDAGRPRGEVQDLPHREARRHRRSEQALALAAKLKDVPIDVLINNAGVYNDRSKCKGEDDKCPGDWETSTFGKMKFSLLDTMMAVNIKGPLIISAGVLSERAGEQAEEDRQRQLEQRHAHRRKRTRAPAPSSTA